MKIRGDVLTVLAIFLFLGGGSALSQAPAQQPMDPAVAQLGEGFVSTTATVNGTTLHYVRGGTGPPVILLHGFPQDWYEFHPIMLRLAKKFTGLAVDLRGVGGSAAPPSGYDAANLAEDVQQLVQHLKRERVYVVGHDIGGLVAYAFARRSLHATRGVMILDVPLPGIEPWAEVQAAYWHIGFHQTPELPEKIIAGRQAGYFRWFFTVGTLNSKTMSDADVAHDANAYTAPQQLCAGFEFYRAFPANEQFNAEQWQAVDVPVVLAGGDHSFGTLNPRIAADLRAHGCANVTIELIKDGGHYVLDEQPQSVAALIEHYAS
jgi:pimeloyl-ACP methyl ester carboxylesterase